MAAVWTLALWGCQRAPSLRAGEWTDARLDWSGQRWRARHGPTPTGAGNNLWSADEEALFVDAHGVLHLRATGSWSLPRAVEVSTPLPDCPLRIAVDLERGADVPEGWIAAVFVYRDDRSEMDLELGRWPNTPPSADGRTHAQFVVAGDTRPISHFSVGPGPATFLLAWEGRSATFEYRSDGTPSRVRFEGAPVPNWEGHRLHVNLWPLPGWRTDALPELLLRRITIACQPTPS